LDAKQKKISTFVPEVKQQQSEQKSSKQDHELIGEPLISPATVKTSTALNPFSGSKRSQDRHAMKLKAESQPKYDQMKGSNSIDVMKQDEVPLQYTESGYDYTNKYHVHSGHPLRSRNASPKTITSSLTTNQLANRINVDSVSPLGTKSDKSGEYQ